MANSNQFKKVGVQVKNRSAFDKSHHNLLTFPVGTLVPALCDYVIDGSRVNLRAAVAASLPPLASDTFMRCQLKVEAFFVPQAGLYGGFKNFASGKKVRFTVEDPDSSGSDEPGPLH